MIAAVVDVSDVAGGIGELRRRLRAGAMRSSVFRPIVERLRGDIREHFANRDGIDGRWPLPANLGERGRGGRLKNYRSLGRRKNLQGPRQLNRRGARQLAKQLGRLRSTIEYSVFGAGVRAVNVVKWAGVHEFGGVAGHGAQIPARSSMYADAGTVDHFVQLLLGHVKGGW